MSYHGNSLEVSETAGGGGRDVQVDDTKLRYPFLPFSKYTYILTVF